MPKTTAEFVISREIQQTFSHGIIYVYSIQVDHVVVGPTGLYLIETKNWSKESVESRDLFSPVKQLRRHSFAMFVLLNQAVADGQLSPFVTNWGEQKISPKNILVLMHHKPEEEFQFVTVLTINELRAHISSDKQIYRADEVESLVSYLQYIGE